MDELRNAIKGCTDQNLDRMVLRAIFVEAQQTEGPNNEGHKELTG